MQQVIQDISSGKTTVKEIPDPIAQAGQVVVATVASLISAGTEKYVVELARKSLVGKAKERPDHVRRVLQKIKQEGFMATLSQVMAKLDEPMPLGYSSSGIVLECGKNVQQFKPGDRVATAAPHAGVVSVSSNLCALIPSNVSFEHAAFTSVASIALEGIRLARVSLGEKVLVIGLGLIGQICVSLLKAQGCYVFGTDIDPKKLALAKELGADQVEIGSPLEAVKAFSDSFGVDSAIITASTPSNEPIEFASEACRSKGRIVLVGVTGLNIPRVPFFQKELEFTVSSSLGAGRNDPTYEEKGLDYPIGYARWTAQRNMQAVLGVIAAGKLPVEKLISHHFPIEKASQAYDLITKNTEPYLGIIINYPDQPNFLPKRRINIKTSSKTSNDFGISLIGAGNFTRLIMMPILSKQKSINWRGLCTAKGMTAEHNAKKMEFDFATTDSEEIWNDNQTKAVFVTTRHNLHSELVIKGLKAGKHIFVEKPLCINSEQLLEIEKCIEELSDRCPILMVGFNRRFAPGFEMVKKHFSKINPLSISYRFSPGAIPANHWTQDENVGGGRIIGEACHAIDVCVALTKSLPVKVYAESVVKQGDLETSDDRLFITLRHENGSVSNISYQTGGDRALPPERIEVFGGGKTAIIDAWNDIELWSNNKLNKLNGGKDKGHSNELKLFIEACRNGGNWPIEWKELYGTTWASFAAVRSLREGFPISQDN